MVKRTLCLLVALTAVAHADDAFNMLGFRIGVGALPVDHVDMMTVSLGLGVEHPVFKKTRVFGDYEWMWLSDRANDLHHGNGHRISLGLRRELLGKGGRGLRVFFDGEVGGGVALTNDDMSGVLFTPGALAGIRFGYDLYSRASESPSRTFEAEFLLRAVAVREGIGMMFGVGMLWGN